VDVFAYKKLLKNICDSKKSLTLQRNTGMTTVTKNGDLTGYVEVWFYEDGIANIL